MAGKGRIENLKPWKPGQSGNPSGRPREDKPYTEAHKIVARMKLKDLLEIVGGKPKTKRDWNDTVAMASAKAAALKASAGDIRALTAVSDRTDDKPLQGIRLEGPDGGAVEFDVTTQGLEEINARIAELTQRARDRASKSRRKS